MWHFCPKPCVFEGLCDQPFGQCDVTTDQTEVYRYSSMSSCQNITFYCFWRYACYLTFERRVNLLDLVALEEELSNKLGIKVDLVILKSLNHQFKPYIEADLIKLT